MLGWMWCRTICLTYLRHTPEQGVRESTPEEDVEDEAEVRGRASGGQESRSH
jgi:hypothetical protein